MNRNDPFVHALAGIVGSIGAFGLTYPLITISLNMQAKEKEGGKKRNSTFELISEILKEKGWKGLYSGLQSGMIGIIATSGIYYYSYESFRLAIEKRRGDKMNDLESLLIAAAAGSITALCTCPIWVVNLRLSLLEKQGEAKNKSMFQTAKSIVKEEGVSSLWKGIVPALILTLNPTIQYASFEKLKNMYAKNGRPSMSQSFFMAAIAKVVATVVTYPYILLKSRLQQKLDGKDVYSGTTDAIQKIARDEGLLGFYRGIESKIVQSVLNSAFTFMFKEQMVSVVIIAFRLMKVFSFLLYLNKKVKMFI
eukprot:TRINITY_DN3614_c0_g1_i1.p1 TRINITY_DN3614_c0_g1~~TRINITY_DN3614_c0_g1_i1.p1  ORF type:complete len:349 (-),score=92.22 TRINITY_DN3614_c0_g1_i1:37-960(-)